MMLKFRQWTIVRKALIWKKTWQWTWYYLGHSGVFPARFDREIFRARIRKEAHTIEKGLALPVVRPAFGQGKIKKLQIDIGASANERALDVDVEIARDVLHSYVDWHSKNGETTPFVTKISNDLPKNAGSDRRGGTIPVSSVVNAAERRGFDRVMLTRRSVRNYKPKIVPVKILEDAIRVAWSSPSVCNRQPWSVAIVQAPAVVRKMLNLQSGNRGFDHVIYNLLVVFADTKAFVEDYELFEPFVDAGIFSGSLVNALHARNIGSCCLNLCVSHKIAARITREIEAPEHYFPVMMISVGYAAENSQVAMSTRGSSIILQR